MDAYEAGTQRRNLADNTGKSTFSSNVSSETTISYIAPIVSVCVWGGGDTFFFNPNRFGTCLLWQQLVRGKLKICVYGYIAADILTNLL